MAKKKGEIYIFYYNCDAYKESLVKVGYSDDPAERLKGFNSFAAVPYPLSCYAVYEVNYRLADLDVQKLLDSISDLRLTPDKEFYKTTPEKMYSVFQNIAKISGTLKNLYRTNPDCSKIKGDVEEVEKPIDFLVSRNNPFSLAMLEVPVGTELTFIPTGEKVKIYDCKTNLIEYKGKTYSLSGYTREFMPDNKKNTSGAYRGPDYFSYEGENLTTLVYNKYLKTKN